METSSKVHLNDTESKQLTRCFGGDPTPLFMRSFTLPSAFSSRVAPWLATAYLGALSAVLPLTPLFASLLFGRLKYLRDYAGFVRKMRIHIAALREGPAQHYFEDVMGRVSAVPAEIAGSCVQCGNCCMDKRCVFLEPIDDGEAVVQCEGSIGLGQSSRVGSWTWRLTSVKPSTDWRAETRRARPTPSLRWTW